MSYNNISNEKIKIIDTILEMYPELKKDKDEIVNNIINKQPKNYILTKYIYKNITYYIDPYNTVIDKNLKFIGIFHNNKIVFNESYMNKIIKNYDNIIS